MLKDFAIALGSLFIQKVFTKPCENCLGQQTYFDTRGDGEGYLRQCDCKKGREARAWLKELKLKSKEVHQFWKEI